MKLRNKKTGEIRNLSVDMDRPDDGIRVYADDGVSYRMYNSLAELNEEWEDYGQHPFWYIDDYEIMCGDVGNKQNLDYCIYTEKQVEKLKAIGNYFETKEEAEKAVEKLKAWKRLKDKGARFKDWFWDKNYGTCIILGDSESDYIDDGDAQNNADLDLLFGGEE